MVEKKYKKVKCLFDESCRYKHQNILLRSGIPMEEMNKFTDVKIAYGIIIFEIDNNDNKNLIWETNKRVKIKNNIPWGSAVNLGTIKALKRLLTYLDEAPEIDNDKTEIELLGDNKCLIDAINGKTGKYREVEKLISKFKNIKLIWTSRNNNFIADKLAKEANKDKRDVISTEFVNKFADEFKQKTDKIEKLEKKLINIKYANLDNTINRLKKDLKRKDSIIKELEREIELMKELSPDQEKGRNVDEEFEMVYLD